MRTDDDSHRRDEEARLAALLDIRVPPEAAAVSDAGLSAVAWTRPGCPEGEIAIGLARLGEGPSRPFRAPGMAPAAALDAVRAGTAEGERWPALGIWGPWTIDGQPSGDPARMEALRGIAAGMDAPFAMLLHDTSTGYVDDPWHEDPDPGGARQGFLRMHPWLFGVMVDVDGPGPLEPLPRDPDATAARVLRAVTEGDAAAQAAVPLLVDRLRWFRGDHPALGARHASVARILAGFPPEMVPPPIDGARRLDPGADREHLALFIVAPMAASLARASGRDLRSVLGRVSGWGDYLVGLARRAGLGVPATRDDVLVAGSDLSHGMGDMARCLAAQVLSPALMARGEGWFAPAARPCELPAALGEDVSDPVLSAAWRLLLGDRTLPALAETSARWHARADGIARALAAIEDGVPGTRPDGPALFPDLDLGDGLYLTCLRTARDLLDEGAPGPDATGAMGLDHCVATYGHLLAMGDLSILSVRRRLPDGGFERLSTAEVNFDALTRDGPGTVVRQHRGRANAPPPPEAVAALVPAIARVEDGARAAIMDFRRDVRVPEGPAAAIHRSGSWDAVRDLWAFALTRPQRSMGPDELLAVAGLPPGTPLEPRGPERPPP